MLYSPTITDTADEVLSTKKKRHILFTRLPGNLTLQQRVDTIKRQVDG